MLEKPLLEETKSYHRKETAELHADNTCHFFITKVLYSSFSVIFCCASSFTVNCEYYEFLTLEPRNEYNNAKKITAVKEATYAFESLR